MSMLKLIAGCATALAIGHAQAQSGDYPNRPIRMVGATQPGTTGDITARAMIEVMEKALGQTLVIEHRGAGGGGLVAANEVKRAAPDGYTLLLGYDSMTVLPATMKSNPFDISRDVAPISMATRYPLYILWNPATPVTSFQQLVSYAKANPGKLNFAIVTNASSHLYLALMQKRLGIDLVLVPYTGGAAITRALLANEAQGTMSLYGSVGGAIAEGKVTLLAVGSAARTKEAPNVPTLREAGVDIVAEGWFALFAPAGTPAAVLSRLTDASMALRNNAPAVERLAKAGLEAVGSTADFLAKQIVVDMTTRAEAAKAAKIEPQ
jgi:tripartite-type tricarboxylate transporter receptor subunit TctC